MPDVHFTNLLIDVAELLSFDEFLLILDVHRRELAVRRRAFGTVFHDFLAEDSAPVNPEMGFQIAEDEKTHTTVAAFASRELANSPRWKRTQAVP